MAYEISPIMSLVTQFDDLCRYNKVVRVGCEKEFKTFVGGQANLLQKLKEAQSQIDQLEKDYKELNKEHSQCKLNYKHLKNLLAEEVAKRKEFEAEKEHLAKQVYLIKEIIFADGLALNKETKSKLLFLHNAFDNYQKNNEENQVINESVESLLSPSECDETRIVLEKEDSFSKKRRSEINLSSPTDSIPTKRNKLEDLKSLSRSSSAVSEIEVNRKVGNREVCNNSNSMQQSIKYDITENVKDPATINDPERKFSNFDSPPTEFTPKTSTPTHTFSSKRVIRSEKCHVCGPAKFPKQVLKCNACGMTCHPKCKDKCPSECSPISSTPQNNCGSLSDFTLPASPMVPPFVVHCIREIEKRGLNHLGIYRKPGRKSEVMLLKEKLLKENISPLKNDNVHVICGALKDFFKSLSDPLIPRSAWRTFVSVSEQNDDICNDLLYEAVCNLPTPNRETLAYLIPHLQKVAGSPKCKMPIENLATVFGPTVVGYSSESPTVSNMLEETGKQINVMKKLLQMPSDSWMNISNMERPISPNSLPVNTPQLSPVPVSSRLGPIYASIMKKHTPSQKSPLVSSENFCSSFETRFFSSSRLK